MWLVRLLFLTVALSATVLPRPADAQIGDLPRDVMPDATLATAPVEIDGETLFRVRGASSFPAGARAAGIADRIKAVAADTTIALDSFRIVPGELGAEIRAGDVAILTVTDADARLEQLTRDELAYVTLERVRQAIEGYRESRRPDNLLRQAIEAAVSTVLTVLVVVTLIWLTRRIDAMLQRRLQARITSIGIQSFEFLRADRIWSLLRSATLALRTIAILLVAIVYLGFVFSQFPWTRGLTRGALGLVADPLATIGLGIVSNIPNAVFLAVLYFVVRFVLRVIRLFFDAVGRGGVTFEGFEAEWALPTYKIVRVAVIGFALIVAYPYIPGSDSAAFKGLSLFLGIVFSLGSSSVIANMIAGYTMTYRRAFKVGDRVKIGDSVGDVVQTRIQVTHLRSLKNEELIIPNSQILNGEVLNYSSLARTEGLILHTEVGIGYETPWRQVEAMLLMAADRTPGLLRQPPPFVLQKALGDFAITYELNVHCDTPQAMNRLYTALHRNILDVFNEYGVQIMTPNYEADAPQAKVVPKADWYAAPAQAAAAQADAADAAGHELRSS